MYVRSWGKDETRDKRGPVPSEKQQYNMRRYMFYYSEYVSFYVLMAKTDIFITTL